MSGLPSLAQQKTAQSLTSACDVEFHISNLVGPPVEGYRRRQGT